MADSFQTPQSSFENRATPPSPAHFKEPPPVLSKETCDLAIASMILSLIGALYGLFCIGLPFAVAGIVCGHIAISKIRSKSLKGRGFALTGLIAGYIVVLLSFLVGAVLVIGVCAAAASDSAEYYSEPVSLEDIDGVGELPLKTEAVE